MNDVQVPEQIYVMLPAMYPVTCKVDADKSNHISKPRSIDMNKRNFTYQPAIGNDCDTEAQHIFGYIGNAAAEAAYHIHIAKGILAFVPAVPLFKKDE